MADARFPNSVIVSAADRKVFTLPHEVTHILTTGDHYEGPNSQSNLMRGGGDGTSDTNGATESKRLLETQETDMYESDLLA
ncbi:MAG: snapalysin family zinc-dependent metalloprotease [Tepidisphaeraceae bacterium]